MEAEEASELPYAIELDSSIAKSKLEPRIISASHYWLTPFPPRSVQQITVDCQPSDILQPLIIGASSNRLPPLPPLVSSSKQEPITNPPTPYYWCQQQPTSPFKFSTPVSCSMQLPTASASEPAL